MRGSPRGGRGFLFVSLSPHTKFANLRGRETESAFLPVPHRLRHTSYWSLQPGTRPLQHISLLWTQTTHLGLKLQSWDRDGKVKLVTNFFSHEIIKMLHQCQQPANAIIYVIGKITLWLKPLVRQTNFVPLPNVTYHPFILPQRNADLSSLQFPSRSATDLSGPCSISGYENNTDWPYAIPSPLPALRSQ